MQGSGSGEQYNVNILKKKKKKTLVIILGGKKRQGELKESITITFKRFVV